MATYKVLQDIESEDKLLGPLTLKQFIFAAITIVFCGLAFVFAQIHIILAAPWLIPIFFFGFMAAPIGRDQPNDVWLAARIRFFLQPRTRVWNQSGLIELVTITVPKKVEHQLTNNLSQREVRSRLGALASTLDSRGWAVKNVNVNLTTTATVQNEANSDRLISLSALPQEVPTVETDITAGDDMLDPMSNMVAKRFEDTLVLEQQKHLDKLKEQVRAGKVEPTPDYSFITNPEVPPVVDTGYVTFGSQVVAPRSKEEEKTAPKTPAQLTDEEQKVLEELHQRQLEEANSHSHERVITPLSQQRPQAPAPQPPAIQPVQNQAPDVKLQELSELPGASVESLASLAKHAEAKANEEASLKEDQTISLH